MNVSETVRDTDIVTSMEETYARHILEGVISNDLE